MKLLKKQQNGSRMPTKILEDSETRKKEERKGAISRVRTSLLLMLLALVAVTATTVAWFSIADRAKVRTMGLDIIAGVDLRMDLDSHSTFEEYKKTLSFEDIAARIQREKGFSMKTTPLEPVTTTNQKEFTFENGTVVSADSGAYLEFTLHFIAGKDMVVHLTSANSSKNISDGTAILSDTKELVQAMRISFEADGVCFVYDPGLGNSMTQNRQTKIFGLPDASQMVLNENNAMFSLKEGEDKAVLVHIWLEGTDPLCTNELKSAEYAIRLRFTGTDFSNQAFDQ